MYNVIIFYRAIIVIVLASAFFGYNDSAGNTIIADDSDKSPLQQTLFDKFTGTWQNTNGKSFERWTRNSDGTYRAVGFSLKAGDTSWNEQASIYKENGRWVFENTVKNQNEGKAIKFVASSISEDQVQFSNPAHDFPTDINYKLTGANTLDAFIVGPNNSGGKDTIPFHFKKIAGQ